MSFIPFTEKKIKKNKLEFGQDPDPHQNEADPDH